MFSKAFTNPTKAQWIIQGASIIWFLVSFLLLYVYDQEIQYSIVDSLIFGLLFLGGITVLDRIFSFYIPRGGNNWLLLILPLILSGISVLIHYYFLIFIFDSQGIQEFLKGIFVLRMAVLWVALTLVTLIAIVVAKLDQQEESRKREAMMKDLSKEAELTQLRQQLQPHFLFNSLNSINALVVSQPKKAREMVLQLSDFLRGTIRKDSKEWIGLEDELNYLRLYLDIEKVRFGHRLEVNFEIQEESRNSKVPQLLIQPLLENAIKHGLYGTTEDVKIQFITERNGSYLDVTLRNPFDPDLPPAGGTGFGLSSVDRRLFLIFGRKDLLKTKKNEGTFEVSIKIPQPR